MKIFKASKSLKFKIKFNFNEKLINNKKNYIEIINQDNKILSVSAGIIIDNKRVKIR